MAGNITTKRQFIEGSLLAILTRATHEQAFMLKDEFKFRLKQDLNTWIKQGENVCRSFEAVNSHVELDNLTDVIHDAMSELRKALSEYYDNMEQK